MKNPPKQYETINLDFKWTVAEEAIHRGMNYASATEPLIKELKQEKNITLHALLKNAYQEGFLHGFEHKFDQTNYEEK
jgi:hypothetical protein